jgi:sulfide:quinone oxidoreductase
MAKVLILGGGFGGVIAAQRLAKELGDEHQITLVARSRWFVFYPALVRLAFGKCKTADVTFNLRETLLSERVNFIEAEVARIDPIQRRVVISNGEVEGMLPYDYLIFALGRRLATERISGFYEHAHHLLSVEKALRFGRAIAEFEEGDVVIGQCPGARLSVPVYETAFALSRLLEKRGTRDRARITVVSPDPPGDLLGDSDFNVALKYALAGHDIDFRPDFPINRIVSGSAITSNGHAINFKLLMLLPPFQGAPAASHLGITNEAGYIDVDSKMRVVGIDRTYAVGDCVNLDTLKMGHLAVRQAEVAAINLASELQGKLPASDYTPELKMVIDEGGGDSIYVHKKIWTDAPAQVWQGGFWGWAKRVQEKYWEAAHLQ